LVQIDYRPQLDAEGKVWGFVSLVNDVTWRHEAEAALRLSEARYREAERIGGLGHWRWVGGPDHHWAGGRNWLVTWDVPEKNDLVSNIERHKVLENAFHFVPGQTLLLNVREQGSPSRQEMLVVKVDSMNNQYLQCERTGAKAFFSDEDTVFYFTGYTGSRRSVLYYFFLAHFKVVKGFYRDMIIEDSLPVDLFHNRFLLFLQDLVAPFYIFIRSTFRLSYTHIQDQLSSPVITLNASCQTRTFQSASGKIEFETRIGEEGIRAFTVIRENHTMEVKCT